MTFLKSEVSRFFAIGFAGGVLLVVGVMGLGHMAPLAGDLLPPAQAAQNR
jgi:hypothetical protein